MNEELARVIDSVSKDKGIEKEIILEAVNESVVSAAHKPVSYTHLTLPTNREV